MPATVEPQLDELRRRARRRLVGAIVLALAAAVVVPMLLESDPKPLGEDVSVKIPPVDEGRFVSRLGDKGKEAHNAPSTSAPVDAQKQVPAGTATAATKTGIDSPAVGAAGRASDTPGTASTTPPHEAAPPKSESPKTPAKGVPVAETSRPAANVVESSKASASEGTKETTEAARTSAQAAQPFEAARTTAPPAKPGGYSVQLAAFSDDKGANALAGKLKKAGHPAYTEPYTTSRGTLWRVRVGPYATRDAAEAAREKLKADGQSGIIAQAN